MVAMNSYCRCGGQKMIKVGLYARRFEPMSGVVSLSLVTSRYEPAWYNPVQDEKIMEVSCGDCGLLYTKESIGKSDL